MLGAQERVTVEGGAHTEVVLPRCGVRFGAALLDALRDGAAPVSGEAVIHDLAVFVRGCTDHGHRDGVVFGEGGLAESLAFQDDGGGEGGAKAACESGPEWATWTMGGKVGECGGDWVGYARWL